MNGVGTLAEPRILAPIIGHNVGDVVEYLIVFAWCGAL